MLWFSRCLVAGDKLGFYDVMWKATAWTSFSIKCTGEYIWDILSIRNYPTLFYFNPFVDSCLSCNCVQARIASFLQTGAPRYHVLSPLHMGTWNFFFPLGKKISVLDLPLSFSQLKLSPDILSWKGFSNWMGVLLRNWNAVRGGG